MREFSSLQKVDMMAKHANMPNGIHMERNEKQKQL